MAGTTATSASASIAANIINFFKISYLLLLFCNPQRIARKYTPPEICQIFEDYASLLSDLLDLCRLENRRGQPGHTSGLQTNYYFYVYSYVYRPSPAR